MKTESSTQQNQILTTFIVLAFAFYAGSVFTGFLSAIGKFDTLGVICFVLAFAGTGTAFSWGRCSSIFQRRDLVFAAKCFGVALTMAGFGVLIAQISGSELLSLHSHEQHEHLVRILFIAIAAMVEIAALMVAKTGGEFMPS